MVNTDNPPPNLGDAVALGRYSNFRRLSRVQQLLALLAKWEELHQNPNFLNVCDEYFARGDRDPVQFFAEWGAFPILPCLLSLDSFQKDAERTAKKYEATTTITVYPWTTTREIIHALKGEGFLKSARKTDFQTHRRQTILLILRKYGFSARNIAEAMGGAAVRKPRKKYSNGLSQRELARADGFLRKLVGNGVKYDVANAKAMRTVRKARYREPKTIAVYRMDINRA